MGSATKDSDPQFIAEEFKSFLNKELIWAYFGASLSPLLKQVGLKTFKKCYKCLSTFTDLQHSLTCGILLWKYSIPYHYLEDTSRAFAKASFMNHAKFSKSIPAIYSGTWAKHNQMPVMMDSIQTQSPRYISQ